MTTTCTRQLYVDRVIRNYLRLPGTTLRASRRDRYLAAHLYDRGIPIHIVWAALAMVAARWALRSPQQLPLPPIRTLYYFLPAIDEAFSALPEPGYIQYLAAKLRPFVREKEARLSTAGQNTAIPGGR